MGWRDREYDRQYQALVRSNGGVPVVLDPTPPPPAPEPDEDLPRGADMPSEDFLTGGPPSADSWVTDEQYQSLHRRPEAAGPAARFPARAQIGPATITHNDGLPRGVDAPPASFLNKLARPAPVPDMGTELNELGPGLAKNPYRDETFNPNFNPRTVGGMGVDLLENPYTRAPNGLNRPTPRAPAAASRSMVAASRQETPPSVSSSGPVSVSKGQAPEQDSDEPPPRGPLGSFLTNLPNYIGNIFAAKAMSHNRPSDRLLQGIGERNKESSARIESDDQARTKFDNRQQWLKRQARQDAIAEEDRQERKGDRATQRHLSEEARDPNSPKNQLFRSAIQKAYPEVWNSLDENQRKTFTIGDAQALQPMVHRQDQQEATQAAIGERKAKLQDAEALAKYKAGLKPKKGGGGGGPVAPMDMAGVTKALADTYGGEDKIPPLVKQRVALAGSLPANKRAAAISQILGQTQTGKRLEDSAKVREDLSDLKEVQAYEKASEGAQLVMEDLRRTKKVLKDVGVDADNYHGEGIPGVGRVENFVSNFWETDKGRKVRQQVRGNVQNLILTLSGKAATDAERTELKGMMGLADGNDEQQLIDGLKRLEEIAKAQIARASARYPNAAKDYEAHLAEQQMGEGKKTYNPDELEDVK